MHSGAPVVSIPSNPRTRQLKSTSVIVDPRDELTNRSWERHRAAMFAEGIGKPHLGTVCVCDDVGIDVDDAVGAVEH
jgi:hypothetical protein